MSKFPIRYSLPSSSDPRIKYFRNGNKGGYSWCINGSPTHGICNVTANCVGWACSRFCEIDDILTGKGFRWKTLCCNAENFIERAIAAGLSVYDHPVLGGIMVWQKGATLSGSDGAGHVAIVEDIISSNKIYTSESGYGGSYFWNQYRTNDNGRWGMSSGYKFRGCIAQPGLGNYTAGQNGGTPAPSEDISKKSVDELAKEVIAGKYGNGEDRKKALGSRYSEVQARVNEILAGGSKPAPTPIPTPAPQPATINVGDTVIVNGVGRSDSYGKGASTRNYVNHAAKVIYKKTDGRSHPYALNCNNNMNGVTGWFKASDVRK